MSGDRPTIPRRKYIGSPIDPRTGKPVVVAKTDYFYRCEACGAWVDRRDLGQLFGLEGEMPHPESDQDH